MTLAEILTSLFPDGHEVSVADGLVSGYGPFRAGRLAVIGIDGNTAPGHRGCLHA